MLCAFEESVSRSAALKTVKVFAEAVIAYFCNMIVRVLLHGERLDSPPDKKLILGSESKILTIFIIKFGIKNETNECEA